MWEGYSHSIKLAGRTVQGRGLPPAVAVSGLVVPGRLQLERVDHLALPRTGGGGTVPDAVSIVVMKACRSVVILIGVVAVGTAVDVTISIAYRPVGRQQGVLRRNIRVGEHIVSHVLWYYR